MAERKIQLIDAQAAKMSPEARSALLDAIFDGAAWTLRTCAFDVFNELVDSKVVSTSNGCVRVTLAGLKLRARVARLSYLQRQVTE